MDMDALYRLYFRDVFLFLQGLTHSESLAEELTQETFFKALNGLKHFDGRQDIRAWLFTVARNCYYSHCRKAKQTVPLDEPFSWGSPTVTVQAVRYRFPHFHAALAGVFGSAASSKTIAVSNTQLLAVVCADETLHYREGQPVSAYRLNGTIVYGTEQELGLYPRA